MTRAEKQAYDRARYAANAEQKKAQARARYHANTEQENARSRHYHTEHRERLNTQDRDRWTRIKEEKNAARRANPLYNATMARAWRARQRETLARQWQTLLNECPLVVVILLAQALARYHRLRYFYNVKRRATVAAASVKDFTLAQWEAVQASYQYRCVYCGCTPDQLEMDHITPLTRGGSHTLHNIVPACHSCNSRKGNRKPLRPVQPLLLLP